MMNTGDGQRVLVTGATRGLGLAISEELLQQGYRVLGTGRSRPKGFEDLLNRYPSAEFAKLDLLDASTMHGFCRENLDGLYGLVNNAALAYDGVLATMHESEITNMVQANLLGTILLTKYAARPMLRARRGRIVNVSSIIGATGFNGLSVYGATKAALNGFTRSLARELGRANITVNAVAPGYLETEMSSGMSDEDRAKIIRRSPLHRMAKTKEVACTVAHLLSPNSEGITGTTLTVDAGSTA